MAEAAKQWVGQTVDGKFRLGEFVGANEQSAVFLTEYEAPGVRKAAIKLVAADSPEAAGLLSRWKHAAALSHPHLIRLLAMGRCEFNDTAILYVVMEYADENLAGVLARRPLGPMEARAILGPVVDALAYIHSKGFVHTRIKPSNIMAEEDLLKISSDGLCRIGESSGNMGKRGAYDPPEASGGRISPAGDVWSLGMTLAEALTQRLPVWERTNQAEPALPPTLPAEFVDLARHCLRRDPQLRWSVADIAARIRPDAPAAPKPILPDAQSAFGGQRYLTMVTVVVLALAALIIGARLFRHHSHTRSASLVAVQAPAPRPQSKTDAPATASTPAAEMPTKPAVPPAAAPVAKPKPETAPAVVKTVPGSGAQATNQARQPSESEKKPTTVKPALPVAPGLSGAAAAPGTSPRSGIVHGTVVQQVLPNASQTARDTIRGTVRVSVKVHVDETGRVTGVDLDSAGPSQYFADRAVKAAQLWKFTPAKMNGRNVPSEWLIRFEIDPSLINVHPTETAP